MAKGLTGIRRIKRVNLKTRRTVSFTISKDSAGRPPVFNEHDSPSRHAYAKDGGWMVDVASIAGLLTISREADNPLVIMDNSKYDDAYPIIVIWD